MADAKTTLAHDEVRKLLTASETSLREFRAAADRLENLFCSDEASKIIVRMRKMQEHLRSAAQSAEKTK